MPDHPRARRLIGHEYADSMPRAQPPYESGVVWLLTARQQTLGPEWWHRAPIYHMRNWWTPWGKPAIDG